MMQEKLSFAMCAQRSHSHGSAESYRKTKNKHNTKMLRINPNLYVSFCNEEGDKWFERNQFLYRWVALRSETTTTNIRRLINKSIIQICKFFSFNKNRNNLSNFRAEKSAYQWKKARESCLNTGNIVVASANIYSFLNINCNNMNGKIFINLN